MRRLSGRGEERRITSTHHGRAHRSPAHRSARDATLSRASVNHVDTSAPLIASRSWGVTTHALLATRRPGHGRHPSGRGRGSHRVRRGHDERVHPLLRHRSAQRVGRDGADGRPRRGGEGRCGGVRISRTARREVGRRARRRPASSPPSLVVHVTRGCFLERRVNRASGEKLKERRAKATCVSRDVDVRFLPRGPAPPSARRLRRRQRGCSTSTFANRSSTRSCAWSTPRDAGSSSSTTKSCRRWPDGSASRSTRPTAR